MSVCLTYEEIVEITGKVRPSAQARVLRAMGIDHIIRPDGSVFVPSVHVEHLFGRGKHSTVAPRDLDLKAMDEGAKARARRRNRVSDAAPAKA